MDEFKYALYVEKLLSLKYVNQLEQEIRSLELRSPFTRYYNFNSQDSAKEAVLIYKLYALAMKLFRAKSKAKLPDKFYDISVNFQKRFHSNLFDSSPYLVKYQDFDNYINLFEYDEVVYLPHIRGNQPKLHSIIGSRKLPFKYEYIDVGCTNFEAYSYIENAKISNFIKSAIANIANQISLPGGRDSTFLNIEFKQHTNAFGSTLTPKDVEQLQATIERLDLHKQAILEAIDLCGGQNVN